MVIKIIFYPHQCIDTLMTLMNVLRTSLTYPSFFDLSGYVTRLLWCVPYDRNNRGR